MQMSWIKAFFNTVLRRRQPDDGVTGVSKRAVASLSTPFLLADSQGKISAANHAARFLGQLLADNGAPGFRALVERGLQSGLSQSDVVSVQGSEGELFFDVAVLPQVDGGATVIAKDITLETNLRAALVESRQRYKDLVDVSSDFAWEVGVDGRFVFVSARGAMGYPAERLVGRTPADFLIEHLAVDGLLPFRSDSQVDEVEIWVRNADGGRSCLLASSAPLRDAHGKRLGNRGICRDITRERQRDAALARASNHERLLTHLVRTIRDVVDPTDMLQAAADVLARALGAAGCQIFRFHGSAYRLGADYGHNGIAEPVLSALWDGGWYEGVVDGKLALGTVTRYRSDINGAICLWRELSSHPWTDDERLLLEEVADQIGIANAQIDNHEHILTLSRTDSLTGLFNRRAFFEELTRRFDRLACDPRSAALIYVDLDNFKAVNDMHGHKRGDEALQATRDILLRHTRPTDLVARLGGDEFALWLEGADERIAVKRCKEMLALATSLEEFSGHPDMPVYDTLSVESFGELLTRADEAMYCVKRSGKGHFRMADPVISGAI